MLAKLERNHRDEATSRVLDLVTEAKSADGNRVKKELVAAMNRERFETGTDYFLCETARKKMNHSTVFNKTAFNEHLLCSDHYRQCRFAYFPKVQ